MHSGWQKQLARLLSNIFNPFLVSTTLVVLISLRSAVSTVEAIKWSLIALALSTLPIFLIVLYLVRSDRLESIFINVRRQRHKIYLLSGLCGAATCIVLYYLEAPLVLVVAFLAGITAVVVFMGINLWWKISVHTAFAASAITLLVLLYGPAAALTGLLLPLIGWSRIELEHHSLTQVATGAVLSVLIVLGIFYLFGLVGNGARI